MQSQIDAHVPDPKHIIFLLNIYQKNKDNGFKCIWKKKKRKLNEVFFRDI